jgi:Kef-type K+ transport system membrane component KefB
MTSDIYLIITLALALWLSPFIARLARIPIPATEILIGSILATIGIIHKNHYFELIAEVGFLYLMFLAGLEVNLDKILKSPLSLIKRGLLFVALLGILSAVIGTALGLNIIFIISLPLISIGLLASLSKTYGKESKWLELAFTVGVMGEVASIIALTVLDAASEVGFGLDLAKKLSILFAFILLIIALYKALDLLFWWAPELKDKLMPHNDTEDQDIRLSMALFFLFIVVMIALHLELALGTFIAGVAISAFFHHKHELEEDLGSFGFGFLVPLFFIHVGSTFDLTAVKLPGVVSGALIVVGLSLLIKVVATFVLKKYLSTIEIILTALSLSMPLTLLVAVATIGYHTKYITLIDYYSLILAAILEILIGMSTIRVLARKTVAVHKESVTH